MGRNEYTAMMLAFTGVLCMCVAPVVYCVWTGNCSCKERAYGAFYIAGQKQAGCGPLTKPHIEDDTYGQRPKLTHSR